MKLTGSEIVIECLKEQGVDTVFGYPGGCILNVYDELYKHSHEITHYLTSHEQGAAHAADGYARATGKVGVCLATSGPGATNLVTGIATAYMDSIPMVAITANVANAVLGRDSFQEIDISGVTMPITKHNYIVKDVNQLADTLRSAFRIAKTGRPGPVLVDITKDVTAAVTEYTPIVPEPIKPKVIKMKQEDVEMAVAMIKEAKKPFIMVGGGVVAAEASAQLRTLAEKMDAPVCDTLMGKGAFDGTNPNYTGMIGMHGTKTANFGVSKCDLLVVVGARFSDRVASNPKNFCKDAKIIQIDVDPAEINKNVKVDCAVIGDCNEALKAINALLEQQNHKEWLDEIHEFLEKYPLSYPQDKLTGPYVLEVVDKVLDGRGVVSTEVGQNQMWAAQYIRYREPRTLLTSGGAGTMGYGLGACIGAQIACPDKIAVNIAGDGCFRMNMNEIATATRYDIPIIQIVLNNHVLGMVRQWQTLFYGKRYSATVLHDKVDFVKLAEAMGAKAYLVTKKEEMEPVLREAIALRQPVVIECRIEEDDKVFPMIAPGKDLETCFDESDLEEN